MDDGEDSEVDGRCPHCGKEWTYASEKIRVGLFQGTIIKTNCVRVQESSAGEHGTIPSSGRIWIRLSWQVSLFTRTVNVRYAKGSVAASHSLMASITTMAESLLLFAVGACGIW